MYYFKRHILHFYYTRKQTLSTHLFSQTQAPRKHIFLTLFWPGKYHELSQQLLDNKQYLDNTFCQASYPDLLYALLWSSELGCLPLHLLEMFIYAFAV
jgi:hypothetical protein